MTDAIRSETYDYIAGIIGNKQGQVLEMGGIDNPIHLVASCPPTVALADFIRDIKANSSKWLHEDKGHRTELRLSDTHGWQTVAYLDDLQAKVDSLKALQAQTAAELGVLLPSVLDKTFKGDL